MNCQECGIELELKDTTFSNTTTERCEYGQHTGDIYYCIECDEWYLDNFLTGEIERWCY